MYKRCVQKVILLICILVVMCLLQSGSSNNNNVNNSNHNLVIGANAASPSKIPYIPPTNKNPVVKCVHDLQDLCMDLKEPVDPWQCMMNKSDDIDDEDCQAWVEGMKACNKDAIQVKECVTKADNYINSLRRCIRRLDDTKYLSNECRSSTFFKDIKGAQYTALAEDL